MGKNEEYVEELILNHKKTEEEHKYTSTGIKFWRHKEAMMSYVGKLGNTVISTHISPEGSCNLNCAYCSVSKRKRNFRISFETIQDYVIKLKSRGLKAVILTGGGEPTLYPFFNELVHWLHDEQNLEVALITNGTNIDRVRQDTWDLFSWVRVSINFFDKFEERIRFPQIKGILGASMVYVGQPMEEFEKVVKLIGTGDVKYVRVLPNCLLEQKELIQKHIEIENVLKELGDDRFFHQFKLHGKPCSKVCHQAYFRPYLSEVNGGTVFPCDSLVLNDCQEHFNEKYAICTADQILDFMDGKIEMQFDAREMCDGCVFAENIALLDRWKKTGENCFDVYKEKLEHENFV